MGMDTRKMENKKAVIPLILLFAIVFFGCAKEDNEQKSVPNNDAAEYIETFTLQEVIGGEVIWELNSDRADMYENKDKVNLTGVFVSFFEKKEKVSTFKADKGIVDMRTKNMFSEGNVIMHSIKDNVIIETNEMNFDNAKKRFLSDSAVRIISDGSITTGEGFEATPDLQKIDIKRNVNIMMEETK
ncbi:MAG: LPS export ABC transporter periplasmic protein LptC [Elusimicrobiota bacterium]